MKSTAGRETLGFALVPLQPDAARKIYHHAIGTTLALQYKRPGGSRIPPGKETKRPVRRACNPDPPRKAPNRTQVWLASSRIGPVEAPAIRIDLKSQRTVGRDGVHPPPLERPFQESRGPPESPFAVKPVEARDCGRQQNASPNKDDNQLDQRNSVDGPTAM